MSLLRAARAEAEVVTPPEPQRPWATKRSNVKKLANPKPHGRPGLIGRISCAVQPKLHQAGPLDILDPLEISPGVFSRDSQMMPNDPLTPWV